MVKGFAKKRDKKKMPVSLYPNKIAPVEFEKERENNTQTPVTSLPATFIPAPGGYQGRIAQAIPGSALQSHPMIDTPQIEIDPSIKAEIEDAVQQLMASDPGYFRGVSKIVALHGGPFGQVSSEDPSVIHLNVDRIKNEVKAKLGSFSTDNPEHREAFEDAVKHALVEVIAHERGHVGDWDPERGFPGGEGKAEQESRRMLQRLFPKGSIRRLCNTDRVLLFVYGTLRDPKIQERVFSSIISKEPAVLEGYKYGTVKHNEEMYPVAIEEKGSELSGEVFSLTPEQLKQARDYESSIYTLESGTLKDGRQVSLFAYKEGTLERPESTPAYPGRLPTPTSPAGGFSGRVEDTITDVKSFCKMRKVSQYSSEIASEWPPALEGIEEKNGKVIKMPQELPSLWQEILVRAYQEGGDELVHIFDTAERMPNLTVVIPFKKGQEMEVHGVAEDEGHWVTLTLGSEVVKRVKEGDLKLIGYINQVVMHEYKHLMDRFTKSKEWRRKTEQERLSLVHERQDIRDELSNVTDLPFDIEEYLNERYATLTNETSAIAAEIAEAVRDLKEQGYDYPYILKFVTDRTLEMRQWGHPRGLEILLERLIKEAYDKGEVSKGTIEKETLETMKQEPWWHRILRKFKLAQLTKTKIATGRGVEMVPADAPHFFYVYKDGQFVGAILGKEKSDFWGTYLVWAYSPNKFGPWHWGYKSTWEAAEQLTGPMPPTQRVASRKQRIGLDIDGVLCDLQSVLFGIASKYIPLSEQDWDQYKIQDTEHGSEELKNKVFEEAYNTGAIANAPVIPDAVDKINELFDDDNTIILITARPTSWDDQTKEWLNNVGLKYHKLFTGVQDKGAKAKEENIDVFVDDQPKNIEDVAEENIPVYAFEQPWNEEMDVPKIKNWKDVKAYRIPPAVWSLLERYKVTPWKEREDASYQVLRTLEEHARGLVDWDVVQPEVTKIRSRMDPPSYGELLQLATSINWGSPKIEQRVRLPEKIRKSPIPTYRPLTVELPEKPRHYVEPPWGFGPPREEVKEEEKIFPPDVGVGIGRETFIERSPAEDYYGPTEGLRNIEVLVKRIQEQQPGRVKEFLGWPKGYHSIEFGDQVLLISTAPMRKSERAIGTGSRAFVLPQNIDGVDWEDFLLGRNPEGKKPTRPELAKKIKSGEINGKLYNRNNRDLLQLLQTIAGVPVTASSIKGFTKTARLFTRHELLLYAPDANKMYKNFLEHYWPAKKEQELKRIREEGYVKDEDIDWEVIKMDVWEEYTNEIHDVLSQRGWSEERITNFLESMDDMIMTAGIKSFTKTAAPRWTTEEKNRLKKLYLKYRERGVPHHIIYKAVAELLGKSYLAVKQKLESMYDVEDELRGHKFDHWDKCKIDQTIQELYRGGHPINRLGLPAALMYQITNHSMPKAQTCGFPAYYDSFDNAMASNILAVGFERAGDKLTGKPISTLEDALRYYRRQEKQAHAWTHPEIVALFKDAHAAGLPLTYSFFRSHPAIYMPLLGVGRSLEGLRDSIKRAGKTWAEIVIEAAPEYVTLYRDNGRLQDTTEEIRVRRFLELSNIPFRRATLEDKVDVTDPELQEMGYRHFIPDFILLNKEGKQVGIVEVFGSVADSGAANTSQIYREKKEAKLKFYPTLPYKFIAINNNADGVELSDLVLREKFAEFIQR